MLAKRHIMVMMVALLFLPLMIQASPQPSHQVKIMPTIFERVYIQKVLRNEKETHHPLSMVKLMYYDMEKAEQNQSLDARQNYLQQRVGLYFQKGESVAIPYAHLHPAMDIFKNQQEILHYSSPEQQRIDQLWQNTNLMMSSEGAFEQAHFSYE